MMTVDRRHLEYHLTSSRVLLRNFFAISLVHISFREFCGSHKENKATHFISCQKIHELYDVNKKGAGQRTRSHACSTILLETAKDVSYYYLFTLIRNFSEKFTHRTTDRFQNRLLLLDITRIIIYDTNLVGFRERDSKVHFSLQPNVCTSSYNNGIFARFCAKCVHVTRFWSQVVSSSFYVLELTKLLLFLLITEIKLRQQTNKNRLYVA